MSGRPVSSAATWPAPWKLAAGLALAAGLPALACAATASAGGLRVTVEGAAGEAATAVQVLLVLTVLSLAPAILVSMTAFVRIIIVLSMLRQAFGMVETPPNTVLISLALFLTLFTMAPVLEKVDTQALQPLLARKIALEEALRRASVPMRDFMVRQTREKDMALMAELAGSEPPKSVEEIKLVQLIPAFMLNEIRTAFQIGFVVFLPFLLIDLVTASVLMSLGMMMVPPAMIALPLKVLMFVLIDGWNLLVRSLVGSFH
jgi:flagellar biosynthetic protein FliP